MRKLAVTTLGAIGLFTMACGSGAVSTERVGQGSQALEALVPLQGCGDVEAYIRGQWADQVNRTVDAMEKQLDDYDYCSSGWGEADAGVASPSPGAGAPSSSSSSEGDSNSSGSSSDDSSHAKDVSGTNNQVANVDEADFVKNDDQYLYIVENGAFRIVRAFPANVAGPVAKVPLEGEPRKLFVTGDRAVVYVAVTKPSNGYGNSGYDGYGYGGYGYGGSSCTYGYDCVPSGDGTATKILVFDISDRAAPKQIRAIDLSGSLLAARRIGDAIHTVTVDTPAALVGLDSYYGNDSYDCSGTPESRKAARKMALEIVRTKNLDVIAKADVRSQLPRIVENEQSAVAECSGYYRPSLKEGGTFTSIVSVDVKGGPLTNATVVSDPGVVYASEDSLYMSVPHVRGDGDWYGSMSTEKQASTVHQFRIGDAPSSTGYQASGVVKGRVLNQFSLDEYEGHLRVATTSGQTPDPDVHSTLSVLERQGSALVLTGKVDDIAKTEDIRSVRFDGPRGFVVTFKKTDPLFAFDLSNPAAPKITGELKIPGFSTYMHMMDAQHLLTIGYDAADQGSFAWFTGVILQIFDVSDMTNPKLLHKESIGTRGSSSEALADHLAFNYFAKKNLLAIPMTICEGGDQNGGYGTTMSFSGLLVYDTTVDGGFHLHGRVAHPTSQGASQDPNASYYDSSGCSNWWANASSEVKRSVFMDDFVYSISNRRVKINALSDLSKDVADIALDL